MYKLGKSEKASLEEWRGRYSPEMKWYGAMTFCGREHPIRDAVVRELGGRGVAETLLPEISTPWREQARRAAGGAAFPLLPLHPVAA